MTINNIPSTQHPLVSIVIPSYKISFFEEALLSACNQDYPNIEIIVTDDRRSNEIEKVVTRYQSMFDFPIYYFRNESQLYGEKNFIKCVYEAHGKYVKFLCDDDILYPTCVSKLCRAMESDNEIVLASSRRLRINEDNEIQPSSMIAFIYPFSGDVKISGHELINFLADYTINFIGEPTSVLCRRDMLTDLAENMFRLNDNFHLHLGDLFLYANLLKQGSLAFLSEPLSAFRVSTEQISQDGRDQENLAMQATDMFVRSIRELGWYSGDNISNQIITVESLFDKNDALRVNLIELFNVAEKKSAESYALEAWLSQRKVPAEQEKELKHYVKNNKFKIAIFFVHSENDEKNIRNTLFSCEKVKDNYNPSISLYYFTDSIHSVKNSDFPSFSFVFNEKIVDGINECIKNNVFDWCLILRAGDEFTPQGDFSLLLSLLQANSYDAIYGDDIYKDSTGWLASLFKPDFNLDFFLSLPGVMSKRWIFKREKLLSLGGFNSHYESAFEFEYITRLIESYGVNSFAHIPESLFYTKNKILENNEEEIIIIKGHLEKRGYINCNVITDIPGRYRICYMHENKPLVSIIIPTKDQLPILQRCITSLLENTKYFNYEIIIINNNSEKEDTILWLDGIEKINPDKIKVLQYPSPFNYSAMNNAAAEISRGEYLLLLNNDTAIIQNDWLDNLLNHGLRPEVGIVGAKLLYPNSHVQHAGVVLGLRGVAEHIFINSAMDDEGYLHRLQVDQNYMIVTAACLLVRRSIYFEVGGLDEDKFKISYNDVDFCLKVREAGYLTVWTPHAIVLHEGSATQKQIDTAALVEKQEQFLSEQDALYNKWLSLVGRDPSYNINLSLTGIDADVSIDTSKLTWVPMQLPLIIGHTGEHNFHEKCRLFTPFGAMKENNLINGSVMSRFLSISEVAKINPHSMIFNQRLYFSDSFYNWCERIKRIVNPYMVYDLNEIPYSTMNRQDLIKMRKVMGIMDRVIVSSNEIANVLFDKKIHTNIIVSPTKLGKVISSPDENVLLIDVKLKPRICWVTDLLPRFISELDFFYNVVKKTTHQVDWVIIGKCPEKFKPYIKEIHDIPSAKDYIKVLMSLNLDIAVIPNSNRLGLCEYSSSRILEYGICGIPTITSHTFDIYSELPIMIIPNVYKNWLAAIDMHLSDLNVSKRQGEDLKKVIEKNWILDQDSLNKWANIWLPG
ncbi:glycosyltransferase family 2 protein [Pectobacterium polonicum]|uniref:glycosyltransferase n=1 Tax=Pectobacterium polonicum TaxID=2485124 RepID=UPI0037550D27